MSKIYQNITRTSKNLPNRCLKPFIQACYYGVKKGPLENACGFTLIELLVVVLIIGILAAVALPQYQVAVTRARIARGLPVLRAIVDARQRYFMANASYISDLEELDLGLSYSEKEEKDGSYVFKDTPIGQIGFSKTSDCLFWGAQTGKRVTVDFCSKAKTCYGWDKTGDRVCASLGPKIDDESSSGWPRYRINF